MTAQRIGRLPCLLAAASLTSALLGVASVAPANAECVSPSLSVRNQLKPGGTATVVGRNFFAKCSDVIVVRGCGAPEQPTGASKPMHNVVIALRQDGQTHILGRQDANKRFAFVLSTTLPWEMRPGRAVLQAETNGATVATQQVTIRAGIIGARIDP